MHYMTSRDHQSAYGVFTTDRRNLKNELARVHELEAEAKRIRDPQRRAVRQRAAAVQREHTEARIMAFERARARFDERARASGMIPIDT